MKRGLQQTATYWSPGAPNETGGRSYGLPVTISCHWEDRTEIFIDPEGRELTSSAVVYVDRDLTHQGYLYFGSSIESNPTQVQGAREIRGLMKISSPSANRTERRVFL